MGAEVVQTFLRPHSEFILDFPNFRELIVQVAVIGPDGHLIASSLSSNPDPVYLGDREHFQVHVGAQEDFVFVSRPVKGKVSGVTTIQFTRPILGERRDLMGVLVVSINPNYISRVTFNSLAMAGMLAYLVGSDGKVRVDMGTPPQSAGPVAAEKAAARQLPSLDDSNYLWRKSPIKAFNLDLAVGYPVATIQERTSFVVWMAAVAFLVVVALVTWYTWSALKYSFSASGQSWCRLSDCVDGEVAQHARPVGR